jgi:hypothetical protein
MRSKSGKEWIYKISRQLPAIGATHVHQDVLQQHQQQHHHEHEYPYHHQQHEN